jgi:hypothetical protein
LPQKLKNTGSSFNMKEHVKNLWVEALNSGEYDQVEGNLKTEVGYCCLGVLCDIYAKTQKKKGFYKKPNELGIFIFPEGPYEQNEVLPEQVQRWAGMQSNEGEIDDELEADTSLAVLNDGGKSFSDIVEVIERNWESL